MNISVCMTTCNGEKYLREQIESILPQLTDEDEFIVSDDGSSDATIDILKSYGERIVILDRKEFKTPSRNFEYALQYCRNDTIFLADQDDVWHPEKLAVMRIALDYADLVVCDCQLVDEKLAPIEQSFFKYNRSGSGLIKNLVKNSFIGCCMGFRRSVLAKALPFPPEHFHDHWIGLIAEKHFNVMFIPDILVAHRKHGSNYSSTGRVSRIPFGKKISQRFHLAKELFGHK